MKERTVLIDIVDPETNLNESKLRLDELESLVKTYGGASVLKTFQRRSRPAYQTYMGLGKLEEILKDLGGADNIDVIILNNILKPRQIYNIEEFCHKHEIEKQKELERFQVPKKIKVWDRVDLILKIFDKHATTAEAKLQIELASIKHMGPRIFGMGLELSRQAGGIGTVGVGETNTEIMKRHLKNRTKLIEDKIKNFGDIQKRQRSSRREKNLKTVALAGYTNAGKSTLIKALTKKQEVYIADALFATLDSKVGELFLPVVRQKVMVADTIGFIQDLPPSLIQAFKTTLAEIVDADLILHVIDVGDSNIKLKIKVVNEILNELLDGKQTKQIYVFNKSDLLENKGWSEEAKLEYIADLTEEFIDYQPQIVSALDKDSLPRLIECIENNLSLVAKS
ncbi:MAG: GTPase HflX [Candidatus Caenarcaniphilales bacterium]|jgi:GTP-binding protein HflX|nr:GTPase HflX [Candidatus Caenarcaniphilales bacterium]